MKPLNRLYHVLFVAFLYGLGNITIVSASYRGSLLTPQTYSPTNGDLSIQLQYFSYETQSTRDTIGDYSNKSTIPTRAERTKFSDVRLEISRIEENNRTTVATIAVYPDPRLNSTQITVSCLYFLFGGAYELEILENDTESGESDGHDERLRQQLEVSWPQPKLSVTPVSIGTYPQQTVDAILEFPGIECIVPHSQIDNVPEFWLELYYCGRDDYCDSVTVNVSQVLYAEQIRGYPRAHLVKLRCDLFGLAGHYVVKLRPVGSVSPLITTTAQIKADWSEQFVFNVHARSISPCDPHTGINVLFEYPTCILDQADRVRLFGKLRADVGSMAPPTTLHYVTEQRVVRGQHSMRFECEHFSEKYVEYCFVYVSQAISGAVADVRMDCLPTLPVQESDVGGWGSWSNWTPCSTTCTGGTRSRYRVCDSPPPRYGAMFCEGPSVETEECGQLTINDWECIYGATRINMPSESSDEHLEVPVNIGADCRCGCIVHLTEAKPRQSIAATAQSCPGRTFWLLQGDADRRIRLVIDFIRLLCPTQYVRIRSGNNLASELIAEFSGASTKNFEPLTSDDTSILVEFYSNQTKTSHSQSCKGGFLIHAQQIQITAPSEVILPQISKAVQSTKLPTHTSRFKTIHVVAIFFTSVIIVVSALLGAQYMFRYRKYRLTASAGGSGSPAHTPRASLGSIAVGQLNSRASSTSTLISEVVSMVKIRPRGRWLRHARLRESIDGEALEHAEAQTKSHSNEDVNSIGSSQTVTNESSLINQCPKYDIPYERQRKEISSEHSSLSPSSTHGVSIGTSINSKNYCSETSADKVIRAPISKRRKSSKNRNKDADLPMKRRHTKSTNSQSYGSVSSISSNNRVESASPDNQKHDTENKDNKLHTNDEYGRNVRHSLRAIKISNAVLANGCYSPASSVRSLSTNRSAKDSKEKRNREKLLAGAGSEFSLANPEDLEIDYYDYNVTNASAAPGSYLGMDPAYLIWIPPIDSDTQYEKSDDEEDDDDDEPHYEELPSNFQISPMSNDTIEAPIAEISSESDQSQPVEMKINSSSSTQKASIISNKDKTPHPTIQMIELHPKALRAKNHSLAISEEKDCETEKETSVVKLSTHNNIDEYYELDDIQFADEDECDNDNL